jgi:glycosyltransferase involved in cell wall biosynthesis
VRLLIATDQWAPDVVGGAARVAAESAQALAARGHETVVLAPRADGRPAVECVGALEVHRCLRRGPLPQTFSDVAEGWRAARRRRGRFDLALVHQNTLAAGFAAARADVPLALVFHSSIPLEQRFRRARLAPPQRLALLALAPALVAIERTAVAAAARALVLSRFSRDILLAAHPGAAGREVTVTGGVDASWFESPSERPSLRARLGLPPARPLLAAVRRLEPRMGHEELLQAAALLHRDGLDFTLALAGDGALQTRLRALAAELGLEEVVVFLGRIGDEELRWLYAAADVSVVPTIAYEGFGMSTVESLAAGTPVVGTRVGATPELLEPLDPRLLVDRPSPEELAHAIHGALDRADDAYRARCKAYAHDRYVWERAIVAWESALAELAS